MCYQIFGGCLKKIKLCESQADERWLHEAPAPKSDREHKHDKAMLVGVPDQILQENNPERLRNVKSLREKKKKKGWEKTKMDKKAERFRAEYK